MTIPALFDEEPAAPTESPASAAPRIDVFAPRSPARPVQQKTGTLVLVVSLGVFVLVLGLAWVAWSIIAGGPVPPPAADRTKAGGQAVAVSGAAAASGGPSAPGRSPRAQAEPLPDVPDAGVLGTVAAAFRTLPKRPSDLAVDLFGKEALSTIQPYQMAWSGSSLFALDERGCAIDWCLVPATAGPVNLDGWIALKMPPGTAESTGPLQVTLPVSSVLRRSVRVPWPVDGTYHRLRCWASPLGLVTVAIGDTVLAEDAVHRFSDADNSHIGLLAKTDMRIGSLRIFGTGDFVRKNSRIGAKQQVLSPGDRLVAVELHDAPRPVPGTYRPYEPGDIIDPFTLERFRATEYAKQLAEQYAAFVFRRLRPYDQGEHDLAARLLWLAQRMDPGSAHLKVVCASLVPPVVAKPDQAAPPAVAKPDQAAPPVVAKPDQAAPPAVAKPDQAAPSAVAKPDQAAPPAVAKPDQAASVMSAVAIPEFPALSKSAEQRMQERELECLDPVLVEGKHEEMRVLCQDAVSFMSPVSGASHDFREARFDWPLLASLARDVVRNGPALRLRFHRLVRSPEGR